MTKEAKPAAVLLVEDHPDLREMLLEALVADGISAAAAGNGAEALEYLRREPPPKLILLDLAMPVMDGFRFREEQQKSAGLKDIPVFILSAEPRLDDKARQLNVAGYMTKPIDLFALLDAVRKRAF